MSSTERNWALDLNSYGSFKSFKYKKIRGKNAMIKVRKTFYHQLIAIGRNLARKTKQREEKLQGSTRKYSSCLVTYPDNGLDLFLPIHFL